MESRKGMNWLVGLREGWMEFGMFRGKERRIGNWLNPRRVNELERNESLVS